MLVFIGITENGCKKLVAIEDGYQKVIKGNLAELLNGFQKPSLIVSSERLSTGEQVLLVFDI